MAKIGFIASSGGHWEELMCLKKIMDNNVSFFVTEDGGQIRDSKLNNAYTVPQINRHERNFVLHFLKLFFQAWKMLKAEKPDFIITTGALIAYPFCLIAKLMDIKVVYIESFARVHNASLTGKLVYPIADKFIVQWESMKELYPNAEFGGWIF